MLFVPLVQPVRVNVLMPVYVMISEFILMTPAVLKPVTLTRSISVSLLSKASVVVVDAFVLSLRGVMS